MKIFAIFTFSVLTSFILVAGSPPVPVAKVANEVRVPAVLDNPGIFIVISPDGVRAKVVFDASESTDPDNDSLQFAWDEFDEGSLHIFGSGVRATNDFDAGNHRLGLTVSDGAAFATSRFDLYVATPAVITTWLIDVVEDDALPGKPKRPLIVLLEQALKSFEQGDDNRALRSLRHFLDRARVDPVSPDPARAMGVQQLTQVLIDTVSGK